MQLVLASTSPRRRELLALLGLSFDVCSPTFLEHPIQGLSPRAQVARFAAEKAQSVAALHPTAAVLGADTIIELDGTLLGKPADLVEARAMLRRLAGRAHEVHTAVALCVRSQSIVSVEMATTRVWMQPDTNQAVTRYLATQESLGKAGAYSIQGEGGGLIERIEGDFTAVVGLPLRVVAELLASIGYPVPENVEALYQRKPYPNWSRFSS
jgi:nucleoside triphosphate pyrophosphatase